MNDHVGESIRARRESFDLTTADLALMAKVSEHELLGVEAGYRTPARVLARIARSLGLDELATEPPCDREDTIEFEDAFEVTESGDPEPDPEWRTMIHQAHRRVQREQVTYGKKAE